MPVASSPQGRPAPGRARRRSRRWRLLPPPHVRLGRRAWPPAAVRGGHRGSAEGCSPKHPSGYQAGFPSLSRVIQALLFVAAAQRPKCRGRRLFPARFPEVAPRDIGDVARSRRLPACTQESLQRRADGRFLIARPRQLLSARDTERAHCLTQPPSGVRQSESPLLAGSRSRRVTPTRHKVVTAADSLRRFVHRIACRARCRLQ
jgi:hypothetical protein